MKLVDLEGFKFDLSGLAYILPTDWQRIGEYFMRQLRDLPSAELEIIHCKDCKWWGYEDDTGKVRVCHAAKHGHISSHWEISIYRTYRGDFYCSDAEVREDEEADIS